MANWLPPFLAAAVSIVVLNLALVAQRVRARRQSWDRRLLRELQAWDGRLPQGDDQRQRRPASKEGESWP